MYWLMLLAKIINRFYQMQAAKDKVADMKTVDFITYSQGASIISFEADKWHTPTNEMI